MRLSTSLGMISLLALAVSSADAATITGTIKGPDGNERGALTAKNAKLNRKDFGLTWNKPLEKAGELMIGDDVAVEVNLEATKDKDETAEATDEIARADAFGKQEAKLPEHFVTGLMTVRVVDVLEAIEVGHHHRERDTRRGERAHLVLEGAPIEQTRQRIGARLRL